MNLHFDENGPRHASAIVFLHGTPLSGRMWAPQLERLSEFHCLAPDLPGHGRSAAGAPFTSLEEASSLVAALIEKETSDARAHLVGLSFGGVVAQHLMVSRPELVENVVLSGTSARLSRFLVSVQALNEPVLRMLKPEQLSILIANQFNIPPEFRRMFEDDLRAFKPSTLMKVMKAYSSIETPFSTRSRTLVAVGQKETPVARRAARLLSHTIPGAVGVMVPYMGHVWNLQVPDLFSQVVRAWVRGVGLPSGLIPIR